MYPRDSTGYSSNRQGNNPTTTPPAPPRPPSPRYVIFPNGIPLDYVPRGDGTYVHVSTMPPEMQETYWRNILAGQGGPAQVTSTSMSGDKPPAANTQPGGPIVNDYPFPIDSTPPGTTTPGKPPTQGAKPVVENQPAQPVTIVQGEPTSIGAIPSNINTPKNPMMGLGANINPADIVFNSPDWLQRLQQLFLNMQSNPVFNLGEPLATSPVREPLGPYLLMGTRPPASNPTASQIATQIARPSGGGGIGNIRLFGLGMRGGNNGVADWTDNAGLGRGVFT